MKTNTPADSQAELRTLLELTERVGSNPLLTQASTGNTSVKLGDVLWVKASGKWMADANQDDILIPLNLKAVHEDCLELDVDPAERYPGTSLETAMHAVLPHRVVVHVHCVNTIAWAVLRDAHAKLRERLDGLRWNWVPYVESGLPLACAIQKGVSAASADIFVLGNHGLVIAGESCETVDSLLREVGRRLDIRARQAHPADYTTLAEISAGSPWELPDDDAVHALGTDAISQAILSEGLLYPCQAIFSNSNTPAAFRAVPRPDSPSQCMTRHIDRPFWVIEGCGVLVSRSMTAAEHAMLSGLAQVVQRIPSDARVRYLTESEIASSSNAVAHHYRELAGSRQGSTNRRAASKAMTEESLAS